MCLLFKDETQETWVGLLSSRDGLRFVGPPQLVYPKHARRWPRQEQGVMSHNLAVLDDGPRGYLIMGGTHKNRALSGHPEKAGLGLIEARTQCLAAEELASEAGLRAAARRTRGPFGAYQGLQLRHELLVAALCLPDLGEL